MLRGGAGLDRECSDVQEGRISENTWTERRGAGQRLVEHYSHGIPSGLVPVPSSSANIAAVLRNSRAQELFWLHVGLLENRAQCALWHIARMIWNSCVCAALCRMPNFMRAGGLPHELETEAPELAGNLAILLARETSHQPATMSG